MKRSGFCCTSLLLATLITISFSIHADTLSPTEEARRTVELMGGPERVRQAARESLDKGGSDNILWAEQLAHYLLLLDPGDKVAMSIRDNEPDSLPSPASDTSEHLSARYLFPGADPWNLDRNYVAASVADADWTIDEVFPGTKLILEGRYTFSRSTVAPPERDCDCAPLPPSTKLVGTVGTHLQWGEGETGLEYGRLTFSPLSYLRRFETSRDGFSPLRDTLEFGVLTASKDDPLGIDDYYELSLIRASRTWQWQPGKSGFNVTLGLGGWLGYAWATSTDPRYEEVTNPIIGNAFKATVNREDWGSLYLEQRVVNGFTFSSPSAGGSVSREARLRGGYINEFYGCLSLDLYFEKRSFNFTDHRLEDLYTKSRRIGAALGCSF